MNIALLLTRSAGRFPQRIAVRCGDRALSYLEADRFAARFAAGLRSLGLPDGARVCISMRNNAEYLPVLFGIWRAGMVAVPVNAKLHVDELAWVLRDSGAAVLVHDTRLDAFPEPVEKPSLRLSTSDGTLDAFIGAYEPEPEVVHADPGETAWLFYTSGTTGCPKGAMLTHRNLREMVLSTLADVMRIEPADRMLHAAALSHGSGMYAVAGIARGAEQLIDPRPSFDPQAVLRDVRDLDVTILPFLAPTMIAMMLDLEEPVELPHLRYLVYGGAPMHVEHVRAALRRFGPVLVQIYGQGEAPMTISVLSRRAHDPDRPEVLAGAGFARTNVELAVLDERDRVLPAGSVGEVCVRGDIVMAGYWGNEEASATTLANGWLHTGDIGTLDERGMLTLLDRTHDTIISGGSNVYPREVEDVLLAHPAVLRACVFGVPHPTWGQAVTAAVQPVAGAELDERELIDFCAQRIAGFKKPKRVQLVDELPSNAYGKVLRRELIERFSVGSR